MLASVWEGEAVAATAITNVFITQLRLEPVELASFRLFVWESMKWSSLGVLAYIYAAISDQWLGGLWISSNIGLKIAVGEGASEMLA